MNIIAAVSSRGEFFYTLNLGHTDSRTFFNFILKLTAVLTKQDVNWREDTVIMLDNAAYHRSRENSERYQSLKVPLLFLGPYHYRMAPVELMFAYIKNRNLNLLGTSVSTK